MELVNVMKTLPKQDLGTLPTPIQSLQKTKLFLNSQNNLYIKRDDLTGVGSGGNKVRSLEYIIGEALQGGYDTIVASGQAQSNLCSLAAACSAKADLDCILVHNSVKPTQKIGNQLLNHLLDVKSIFLGDVDSTVRENYVYQVIEDLQNQGKKPYLIRNGATTGTGALGYVNAIIEMMNQCKEENLNIKNIFAPGGNGGIATGLIYGNALMGFPFNIYIISVEDTKPVLISHIENTIKEIESITSLPFNFSVEKAATIIDDYMGEGWSINTQESVQHIPLFAKREGIYIENVYTSKLMVGFEDLIKKGLVQGDSVVIHTGGFGSLFSQYNL